MLRKLKDMERLPENAILVTIDVVELYPHIPHEEGLQAIRRALDQREEQGIPTEDIVDLASIVLKNNNFVFDEKHFVQKSGTAIGTKMAPSYANLFMDDLERKIISASTLKPYMWLRFIDDVFMIWTHGEERLREFLDFINGFHNSIKFTWEWSQKKVNFLDIQIINNGGQVDTDLYVKPTDKHQYLTYNSCHSRGCKTSIPYAQAMRLKRICSTQEAFERRAEELTEFLVHRGYQRNMVRLRVQRAGAVPREIALTPRRRENGNRIPFVVSYHPCLPNIGGILRELQPVLESSERCKQAFKDLPVMAFRRPKSLKDYLVRARLKPADSGVREQGTVKCGNKRCMICKEHLKIGQSFTSKKTNKSYSINYHLDCNSENVVYLLSCRVCNLQYVGSTITSFRLRFNNHKSRIATHSKASRAYKDMDDPLYKHFCSAGHQGVKDVEVTLIDRVNGNECDLREKEGQWAYRLKTLTPDGLNTNDFFYSQNRKARVRH